jgi:hypothetical protein
MSLLVQSVIMATAIKLMTQQAAMQIEIGTHCDTPQTAPWRSAAPVRRR